MGTFSLDSDCLSPQLLVIAPAVDNIEKYELLVAIRHGTAKY